MLDFFADIKTIIHQNSSVSRDLLHVYGGILFFLGWGIFRGHTKLKEGLLLVILMATFNEILDLGYYSKLKGQYFWFESLKDMFNTICIPVIVFLYINQVKNKSANGAT